MLHRLKIEWMKLKSYRTFWILFILYILSIFAINYIILLIMRSIYEEEQAKGIANMLLGDPPYSFPAVWQSVAHVSSYLLIIPGLLMIISVTNEYSYKTHRQNVIDGWGRTQFISTKIVCAVILAFISTVVVFLAGLVFGLMDGSASISFDNFSYIGYSFLQAVSYIMVAVLIATLVKRGALAIGVYFLYALILEEVIVKLLNRYANDAGRYLPLETTDLQVPFPIIQRLSKQIPNSTVPNYTLILLVSLVYLGAYVLFTWKKFKTADL